MDRDLPDFVGREKKGQAALRRLFFLAAEEVGKTCLWRQAGPNGKTSQVDRRSVSARGGLDWKVFSTSAGLGNKRIKKHSLLYSTYEKLIVQMCLYSS